MRSTVCSAILAVLCRRNVPIWRSLLTNPVDLFYTFFTSRIFQLGYNARYDLGDDCTLHLEGRFTCHRGNMAKYLSRAGVPLTEALNDISMS